MPRTIDALIIGAGQAGLAMSHCLSRRAVDHVVLERGRIGERWLSERWPGLRLLTPNWMMRLPGPAPSLDAPRDFLKARAFPEVLSGYSDHIGAPVETGCDVLAVRQTGGRFRVETSTGDWIARSVVVATGACDKPSVPSWAGSLPDTVHQLAPSGYRGVSSLPKGNVLIVGASATGVQLAAEIRASGREVTLAAGRHVRTPRRYRGRDLFEWLDACGFLDEGQPAGADPARLRVQPSLQLIGDQAGGNIDLDQLAASGVRIVGRALHADRGAVQFSADLSHERAAAERRRQTLLTRIDAFADAMGIDAPAEPDAWTVPADLPAGPDRIDLAANGISTVIWATGFRRCYPWLKIPVLDRHGEIATFGGHTAVPGLFVLGLPYMRRRSSAFIDGVGRDAEDLAPAVSTHLTHRHLRAA